MNFISYKNIQKCAANILQHKNNNAEHTISQPGERREKNRDISCQTFISSPLYTAGSI